MNSKWRFMWFMLAVVGLLANSLLLARAVRAEDANPTIKVLLDDNQIPVSIEASGLLENELENLKALPASDASFTETLAVYVVDQTQPVVNQSLPAISGRYKIEDTRVIFTPRHPLQPGLNYRAVLRAKDSQTSADGKPSVTTVEREFTVPKKQQTKGTPSEVEWIFPSDNELPENLLRFYIHFSGPMNRGEAYRNLALLDESGEPIEAPFLELGEELWDPSGSRFTLLLDPGRVKHGLKPREELGPVLKEGSRYTLVVKQNWRDGSGNRLKSDYRKSFAVGPAIEKAIDCANWKVRPGKAGSKDQVFVAFDRRLDHALLSRTLSVETLDGQSIEGRITSNCGELICLFHPKQAWAAGSYFLVISPDLEDPCGNRIDRSFEVLQKDKIDSTKIDKPKRIRFEVREPAAK